MSYLHVFKSLTQNTWRYNHSLMKYLINSHLLLDITVLQIGETIATQEVIEEEAGAAPRLP